MLHPHPDRVESPIGKVNGADRPAHGISLANLLLVCTIPCLGGIFLWAGSKIVDPQFSVPVVEEAPTYTTIPKTLTQITAQLAVYDLSLTDRLEVGDDRVVYGVMAKDIQGLQEIRLYRQVEADKLVLDSILPLSGMDETTVRSLVRDLSPRPSPTNNQRRWRLLPLTKLEFIANSPQGYWFIARGQTDGISYGRIIYYDQKPRPQLRLMAEWSSPKGDLPQWQNWLGATETQSMPQLVVNQSQHLDPKYQVFIWEQGNQPKLREVTLPTNLAIRRLAMAGLWPQALAHFNTLRSDKILAGTDLSPTETEQYNLILRHAELLDRQVQELEQNPKTKVADLVYIYVLAGRWQTALDLLNSHPKDHGAINAMLLEKYPHLWQRVQALIQTNAPETPALKSWGALTVLARSGLRQAETWLQEQSAQTQANLELLQKLDLAPLGISPRFFIGSVGSISDRLPAISWYLAPALLGPNQVWVTVNIDIIADSWGWLNAPFGMVADRSSLLLWRVLGLANNPRLQLTTTGQKQRFNLVAHSLNISAQGQIQLLATADQTVISALASETTPPIVHSTNLPSLSPSLALSLGFIPAPQRQKMLAQLYQELGKTAPIDLTLEQFMAVAVRWQFYSVDFNGDGTTEIYLPLERSQINAGDRPYPLVVIFGKDGKLTFSDIDRTKGRQSFGNLFLESPPKPGQAVPLLIQNRGRFQTWQLP